MKKFFKTLWHLIIRSTIEERRDRLYNIIEDKYNNAKDDVVAKARLKAYLSLLLVANKDTLDVIEKKIDKM